MLTVLLPELTLAFIKALLDGLAHVEHPAELFERNVCRSAGERIGNLLVEK